MLISRDAQALRAGDEVFAVDRVELYGVERLTVAAIDAAGNVLGREIEADTVYLTVNTAERGPVRQDCLYLRESRALDEMIQAYTHRYDAIARLVTRLQEERKAATRRERDGKREQRKAEAALRETCPHCGRQKQRGLLCLECGK